MNKKTHIFLAYLFFFKFISIKKNYINKRTHIFPCIPIFKKFVTIKKNHINKKTYVLIPMIPAYFIISRRIIQ